MPDYRKNILSSSRFFHPASFDSTFSRREIPLPSGLVVREYRMTVPLLAGRSLLFFSDTHIQAGTVRSIAGMPGRSLRWNGTGWLTGALREAVARFSPDYLLFGGDLITYSSLYPEAMEMMAELKGTRGQFAVYGNWDKRRRSWLPFRVIEGLYEKAGWKLLVNESVSDGALELYGLDDYKIGIPRIYPLGPKKGFSLLLSHNPDAVAAFPPEELERFDLALCGHTHGGQIRIPGFGALKASSRYWKRFEYGAYQNRKNGMKMIVSAGIGTTLLPVRILCPPEIILLKFLQPA